MIIKKSAYLDDVRTEMRSGNGTITLSHILSGDNLPPNCRIFSLITLPAGASIGEHAHNGEAELFYFLDDGTVLDDGIETTVHAGDSMLTGNGHTHSVINSGKADLRMIAIVITE